MEILVEHLVIHLAKVCNSAPNEEGIHLFWIIDSMDAGILWAA